MDGYLRVCVGGYFILLIMSYSQSIELTMSAVGSG